MTAARSSTPAVDVGESKTPRTIIHVSESYASGVASAIRDYVRNSPQYEHHLVYAKRLDSPIGQKDLDGFLTVRALPLGHMSRLRWLGRCIRSNRGAVIHAHSSLAGAYVRLAARSKKDTPIVYTPHCYAFERTDLPWSARMVLQSLEWILSLNTACFAACSIREAKLSGRWLSSAGVVFVPNVPPEVSALEHAPAGRNKTKLLVVGAGRLGAQKDPDFFAATVQALWDNGYEFDARWIGGGDTNVVRRLERAGIAVTGWQSRDSAIGLLAEADVYIHSAAWEGFPIAILEAASLGALIVVRSIRALDGVKLPIVISSPSDVVDWWARVEDLPSRLELVKLCQIAMADYSDVHQTLALASIYERGIDDL